MKTKIIAIVGASGSGKTEAAKLLQATLKIPTVCSYTKRPMREGEENGTQHWFVPHDYKVPENPLAYTVFGGYEYWAEHSQVEGLEVCTYVIDEKGLIELIEKFGDRYEVIPIKIERKNSEGIDPKRIERDRDRVQFNGYRTTIHNDRHLVFFYNEVIKTVKTILNIK